MACVCLATVNYLLLILSDLLFVPWVQAAGNMPAALPGGKPSIGPSAPSGPASYPTMLAPKHPDAPKDSAAQPNGAHNQSEPTNGHAADATVPAYSRYPTEKLGWSNCSELCVAGEQVAPSSGPS